MKIDNSEGHEVDAAWGDKRVRIKSKLAVVTLTIGVVLVTLTAAWYFGGK